MTSDSSVSLTVHVASAPGVSGIAVVEVFGSETPTVMEGCFRAPPGSLPSPGQARFGSFVDREGQPIDDVIVTAIGVGASWCGLPGWAIYCHGGAPVIERVVARIQEFGATVRSTEECLELATGGESGDPLRFPAYRLFLDALTERASRYFLAVYRGALVGTVRELFESFLSNEDVFDECMAQLEDLVQRSESAVRLGQPLRVLIAGPPNAGKSTLFNALLGRDRVIVSPLAGTTRDLIEETIEISGYPVTLIDSAGVRPDALLDPIERAGIEGVQQVPRDVIVHLSESGARAHGGDEAILAGVNPARILAVRSKADLEPESVSDSSATEEVLRISAVSGAGLEALRDAICSRWLGPPESEELGPLPYTRALQSRFGDLHGKLSNCGPILDGIRQAFLECFGTHVVQFTPAPSSVQSNVTASSRRASTTGEPQAGFLANEENEQDS